MKFFNIGDKIRLKGTDVSGDIITKIYQLDNGWYYEFEKSEDTPVNMDWELVKPKEDIAKEKALKAYPEHKITVWGPLPGASKPNEIDDNLPYRTGYIRGYDQAKEDSKLTWQDISILRQIIFDYNRQIKNEMSILNDEKYCKEILKRFNNK